jgi:hypothetical protein
MHGLLAAGTCCARGGSSCSTTMPCDAAAGAPIIDHCAEMSVASLAAQALLAAWLPDDLPEVHAYSICQCRGAIPVHAMQIEGVLPYF